ncbi:tyrosyl-tRNA synthetase [Geodermatophilus bullaregiensis]|uniref:tyrosine--tRNA ligase n=1 Tax=Geodermatophilus bullaregiensis TaxID=1564160 RepID=UPI00195DC9CB|nr:tyrosine--tRNA ligase [Geodermatophilus bullaregiensis]MBM7804557.1 tyrosyl-tRNA synthetase [Geodermatophilus bullaregiensis]
MTDVIDELHRRGLIAQTTDEEALRAHLAAEPVTYYCGFDPTAPSLHVGHLVQFMVLRALQRAGHRPIVLVGGATGLIGDPRPSAERQLNDRATVAGWVESIRRQVAPFLDLPAERDGLPAPVYVDNLTWTAPLSAIDLLRDLGKHFRVGRMLAKEAVSARLNSEAGISYTEFSYQILQANDFRELFRRHGCTLQSGGSDQWGNLTAGIDLVRRTEGATVHALSTQLVTKADGTKFGKSEGGSVWLDPALTSPYAFFQFWLNADDADARTWLRLFSERPAEEVEALVAESVERPAARAAQRALAEELTVLVHGAGELRQAEAAGRALFGREDLAALGQETLGAALREAGSVTLDGATPTVAQLLQRTGLASSLSDARRTVKEGGAYLNNERVTDADAVPGEDAWLPGGWLVLRRGKRAVAGVQRLLRDAG